MNRQIYLVNQLYEELSLNKETLDPEKIRDSIKNLKKILFSKEYYPDLTAVNELCDKFNAAARMSQNNKQIETLLKKLGYITLGLYRKSCSFELEYADIRTNPIKSLQASVEEIDKSKSKKNIFTWFMIIIGVIIALAYDVGNGCIAVYSLVLPLFKDGHSYIGISLIAISGLIGFLSLIAIDKYSAKNVAKNRVAYYKDDLRNYTLEIRDQIKSYIEKTATQFPQINVNNTLETLGELVKFIQKNNEHKFSIYKILFFIFLMSSCIYTAIYMGTEMGAMFQKLIHNSITTYAIIIVTSILCALYYIIGCYCSEGRGLLPIAETEQNFFDKVIQLMYIFTTRKLDHDNPKDLKLKKKLAYRILFSLCVISILPIIITVIALHNYFNLPIVAGIIAGVVMTILSVLSTIAVGKLFYDRYGLEYEPFVIKKLLSSKATKAISSLEKADASDTDIPKKRESTEKDIRLEFYKKGFLPLSEIQYNEWIEAGYKLKNENGSEFSNELVDGNKKHNMRLLQRNEKHNTMVRRIAKVSMTIIYLVVSFNMAIPFLRFSPGVNITIAVTFAIIATLYAYFCACRYTNIRAIHDNYPNYTKYILEHSKNTIPERQSAQNILTVKQQNEQDDSADEQEQLLENAKKGIYANDCTILDNRNTMDTPSHSPQGSITVQNNTDIAQQTDDKYKCGQDDIQEIKQKQFKLN